MHVKLYKQLKDFLLSSGLKEDDIPSLWDGLKDLPCRFTSHYTGDDHPDDWNGKSTEKDIMTLLKWLMKYYMGTRNTKKINDVYVAVDGF